MTCKTFWFSLSIIFQLSGAILLILHYFTNTKKKIAYEYFMFEGFVTKINDDMKQLRIVDTNRLSDIIAGIYMNRTAFIYLVIGYALAVIGNNESTNPYILMLILIMVGILFSIITFNAINKITKRKSLLPKYSIINKEENVDGAIVTVLND